MSAEAGLRARARLGMAASLVLAIALALWALLTAWSIGAGRILAGTRIGGVPVGLLRPAAAALRLPPSPDPSTLRLDLAAAGSAERRIAVGDLGLIRDPQASAAGALTWSRSRQGRASALFLGLGAMADRPWIYGLDEDRARAYLLGLAAELERPARSPGLRLEAGRVVAVPGTPGLKLDLDASLSQVRPIQRLPGDGSLIVQPIWAALPAPELRIDAADKERLEHRLSTTVTLEGYDPIRDERMDWTLGPSDWSRLFPTAALDGESWHWLPAVGEVDHRARELAEALGQDRYVDPGELLEALRILESGASVAPLRIRHRPGEHVVAAAETLSSIGADQGFPYPWILAENPGIGPLLRPGQRLRLPSPDVLVPLPPLRNRRILVFLARQRMQSWEQGALQWEWPVSTGVADSPTAVGVYQVQERQREAFASAWDLWMPHFLAIYKPDPTRQVFNGFHGIPWYPDGRRVWAELLGRPASYGCIVLQEDAASKLYDWALPGTVVEVRP